MEQCTVLLKSSFPKINEDIIEYIESVLETSGDDFESCDDFQDGSFDDFEDGHFDDFEDFAIFDDVAENVLSKLEKILFKVIEQNIEFWHYMHNPVSFDRCVCGQKIK